MAPSPLSRYTTQLRTGKYSSITRGGFWLMSGYAVQVLLGLILAASFAYLLPKQAYGTYQFILSMAAIVSIFTLTGMGTAVAKEAAQGNSGALRYGTRTQLLWSIGVGVASLSLAAYYLLRGNTELSFAFVLLAVFQPLILAFGLYRQYLYGIEAFRVSTAIDVAQRTLPFLVSLLAVYLTRDVVLVLLAFFVSQALSLSLSYLYVVWKYRLPYSKQPKMYGYSKHLSVMESLAEVAAVIDKILVWNLLGAAALAAYALAQLPVVHMQNLAGFGRTLAFPKLASMSFKDAARQVPRAMAVFFLLAALFVATYILLAPWFFAVLFPAYPEAVAYSQALALCVLAVPRTLILEILRAHQFTKQLYAIQLASPLIRITLLLTGILMFGIWGAIVSILIAETIIAALQWTIFTRVRDRRN